MATAIDQPDQNPGAPAATAARPDPQVTRRQALEAQAGTLEAIAPITVWRSAPPKRR